MHIKQYTPWWFKIFAKIILARLPFKYQFWQKLSLFKHGFMENPKFVYNTFQSHYEKVKLKPGFVSLELGPGDSLSSALVSKAYGASKSYLVDVGDFAKKDILTYQKMLDYLVNEQKISIGENVKFKSIEEMYKIFSIEYLTQGLQSLKTIPSKSIDFIWSSAVLEHVKKVEFLEVMQEFRRILKDDGICSHRIDLRDHLGGGLNNLRFSEKVWESDFFSKSGFYTNRIRYSEMVELFKLAKFEVEVLEVKTWDEIPTKRKSLNSKFQTFSDEELCVSTFAVHLKPL